MSGVEADGRWTRFSSDGGGAVVAVLIFAVSALSALSSHTRHTSKVSDDRRKASRFTSS